MISLSMACVIAERKANCKMKSYYETSDSYILSFSKLNQPRYGGCYFKVNKENGNLSFLDIMKSADNALWKGVPNAEN